MYHQNSMNFITEPINLFSPGNLHKDRFNIVEELKPLVKTGDIFVRLGNIKYYGIPIEKTIAAATKSKYSHASISIVEDDIYIFEVNDEGTLKLRLVDWLSYVNGNFAVYRLPTEGKENLIRDHINFLLKKDLDYDFNFNDPDKFYCTESVSETFIAVGIEIAPPKSAKEILKWYSYPIFLIINYIVSLTGNSFPSTPLYFVGNENQGILSTKGIEKIYEKVI